jgi:hypothetical protein
VSGADYGGLTDVVAVEGALVAFGNSLSRKRVAPEIQDFTGRVLQKR